MHMHMHVAHGILDAGCMCWEDMRAVHWHSRFRPRELTEMKTQLLIVTLESVDLQNLREEALRQTQSSAEVRRPV